MLTSATLRVGATVGPALGGYLGAKGDFRLGARLAAVGSLVSVVLVVLFLPPGLHGKNEKLDHAHTAADDDDDDDNKKKSQGNYRRILAATWPQLGTKVGRCNVQASRARVYAH